MFFEMLISQTFNPIASRFLADIIESFRKCLLSSKAIQMSPVANQRMIRQASSKRNSFVRKLGEIYNCIDNGRYLSVAPLYNGIVRIAGSHMRSLNFVLCNASTGSKESCRWSNADSSAEHNHITFRKLFNLLLIPTISCTFASVLCGKMWARIKLHSWSCPEITQRGDTSFVY